MSSKNFNDRVWPVGLAVAMAVFLALILAVVTVAVRHRPELISSRYYAEGYNLKELSAKQAATEATGWSLAIRTLPTEQAGMPLLEVEVHEADGQPCGSLIGELALYRPSDQALDIPSAKLRVMGAGKYFVPLPRTLERGSWQAIVHLTRGRQEYYRRHDFFVER